MKLKLEELMLYGNNLKVLWQGDIIKVEGYDFLNNSIILERINVKLSDIKPILRPLSNYEDIDEILNEMNDYEIIMIEDNPDLIKRLSYDVIELMFKNHIDIFGLIPKGLAIDKNTL
jgi:hypothetical protein